MYKPLSFEDRLTGVLLGTAAGDALGLPAEGLSPARIRRRWGGEWRMRLVAGRGMVSDDTEHTMMVAQALLATTGPETFQRSLAWKLRWWLLALPAGVGLATARACIKLWMGIPPARSGVKSAGNGAAMRSALLGVYWAGEPEQRRKWVEASARLTHTDERAVIAAWAVAEAAAWAVQELADDQGLLSRLRACGAEAGWQELCSRMEQGWARQASVADFVRELGLEKKGVTGYAYHTVPVAIYCWHRHAGDFRAALTAALDAGGDTDTVGAIVGGLAGASGGEAGIPPEWLAGIWEWPRSLSWMRRVAGHLARQKAAAEPLGSVPYFWPGILLRNLCFLAVVLAHGFRRLGRP